HAEQFSLQSSQLPLLGRERSRLLSGYTHIIILVPCTQYSISLFVGVRGPKYWSPWKTTEFRSIWGLLPRSRRSKSTRMRLNNPRSVSLAGERRPRRPSPAQGLHPSKT